MGAAVNRNFHPDAGGGTTCQILHSIATLREPRLPHPETGLSSRNYVPLLTPPFHLKPTPGSISRWDPRRVNPASQQGDRTNRKQRRGFRLGAAAPGPSVPPSRVPQAPHTTRLLGRRVVPARPDRVKQTHKSPQAGQVNTPPRNATQTQQPNQTNPTIT